MKAIILSAAIILCVVPARAERVHIFLECRGHDDLHGVQTEHEAAIFSDRAEVDGSRYQLRETSAEFTLTGPAPKNDRVLYINRLTGEWVLTPSTLNGDPTGKLESSGKGEGCEVKQRKF